MPPVPPREARDWVRAVPQGYFTVLYTPFTEAGRVDEVGLRHNVRLTLARPGVGGISLNSLHQEFWVMTLEERRLVTEIVLDEVRGRVPVVVGCSDPVVANVLTLADHAAAHGASLAMVWPPYYGPRSAESVAEFYAAIAPCIPLGMVAYSTTLSELGFYLDPGQVASLLRFPALCAVQNTTLSVAAYAAMMERVGAEIAVATSLEEYHLFGHLAFSERAPRFLIGASRPVLCQDAAHPLCGDFLAALGRGDHAGAAAQARLLLAVAERLQSAFFARGFHHLGLFKAVAGMLGFAAGGLRPGVAAPSAAELIAARAALGAAGLLPSESETP
jgi:4-hydroxy-tetrahydrodipicolinate synthase